MNPSYRWPAFSLGVATAHRNFKERLNSRYNISVRQIACILTQRYRKLYNKTKTACIIIVYMSIYLNKCSNWFVVEIRYVFLIYEFNSCKHRHRSHSCIDTIILTQIMYSALLWRQRVFYSQYLTYCQDVVSTRGLTWLRQVVCPFHFCGWG